MGRRIAVFGTGYLGATHAACMAELGHEVLGVDIDAGKLAKLQAGEAPFYEPGLDEVLKENVDGGRLRFTSSYEEAAEFADVHFIAVATPQRQGEFAADLTYVDAVVETLAPMLRGPAVIFGKSTVPVGTAARLGAKARELAPAGDAVEVAWNPEFLREGYAVADTLRPDRIVLGVDTTRPGQAQSVARDIYGSLIDAEIPFLVTGLETAELVKTAANAFLATKVSFINAMAELCDVTGGDVSELADAIGLDTRIGRKFLNAGIGFGGGCLPKDIRAFMARAGELGASQALTFLREVDSINMRRRSQMMEMTREVIRRLADRGAGGDSGCGIQTRFRRCAGFACTEHRRTDPASGRLGHCVRPQGDGQLAESLSDARLRDRSPRSLQRGRRDTGTHRMEAVP